MSKWPWPFNAAIGFIGKYSVHNFTLVLQLQGRARETASVWPSIGCFLKLW